MIQYGLTVSPRIESELDELRKELEAMDDDQDAETYRSATPPSKDTEISDGELKSLFTTLRFGAVSMIIRFPLMSDSKNGDNIAGLNLE